MGNRLQILPRVHRNVKANRFGNVIGVYLDVVLSEESLPLANVFQAIQVQTHELPQFVLDPIQAASIRRRAQFEALAHPIVLFSMESECEYYKCLLGHGFLSGSGPGNTHHSGRREPTMGLEPATYGLQNRRSAN